MSNEKQTCENCGDPVIYPKLFCGAECEEIWFKEQSEIESKSDFPEPEFADRPIKKDKKPKIVIISLGIGIFTILIYVLEHYHM